MSSRPMLCTGGTKRTECRPDLPHEAAGNAVGVCRAQHTANRLRQQSPVHRPIHSFRIELPLSGCSLVDSSYAAAGWKCLLLHSRCARPVTL